MNRKTISCFVAWNWTDGFFSGISLPFLRIAAFKILKLKKNVFKMDPRQTPKGNFVVFFLEWKFIWAHKFWIINSNHKQFYRHKKITVWKVNPFIKKISLNFEIFPFLSNTLPTNRKFLVYFRFTQQKNELWKFEQKLKSLVLTKQTEICKFFVVLCWLHFISHN